MYTQSIVNFPWKVILKSYVSLGVALYVYPTILRIRVKGG